MLQGFGGLYLVSWVFWGGCGGELNSGKKVLGLKILRLDISGYWIVFNLWEVLILSTYGNFLFCIIASCGLRT